MLIEMSDIYSYVMEDLPSSSTRRPLREGERVYLGEHIFACGCDGSKIIARCLTSKLAAEPHTIEIVFGNPKDFKKWNCICSCKAGAGTKCKHIVGTLFFIYNAVTLPSLSCTELAQVWGKRKQASAVLTQAKPVSEFCHVPKKEKTNNVNTALLNDIFRESVAAVPNSELACHMQGRIKYTDIRENMLEILFDHCKGSELTAMLYNLNISEALRPCCVTTYNRNYPCDALQICRVTMFDKEAWLRLRKYRITGTRCYSLYTYSKDDWEMKVSKYLEDPDFLGNKATRYGQEQEKYAQEIYLAFISEWGEIINCGLVVCQSSPWLAVSPDGIVFKNGKPFRLLEIKCPIIGATKNVMEVLPTLRFMELRNNKFHLKERHQYYAQVQLGMAILNLSSCDFIIYSSYDGSIFVETIQRDEEFCTSLFIKLKHIFFRYMLHGLCTKNLQ